MMKKGKWVYREGKKVTIKEAIKYVISLNDDFILLDSKRFIAYLRDLCSEEVKPLKALQNVIKENNFSENSIIPQLTPDQYFGFSNS